MNPDQLLAHFKRLTATLSGTQLMTLAGVFIAVVGILVGTAYWINAPNYTVLFSDMDSESASAVVTRLKTDKVQYVIDDGGRTVRVPTQRVDELRLEFSSQGMPASGRIGFEIFDRTAFGTTEFLEHVNYRRALEGELARTIGTISEVSSARVHIAMAKESLFSTQSQQAKASVVLKLKGRKPLAPQTIAGITGLVASSVEDLRPEAVVVLDTFGRSLTSKGDNDDDDVTGMHLDRQRRMEKALTAQVVSLLEPVVGEGRVRVNVAARINADSSERTEEHWDPETVLRSKVTSSDVSASPNGGGASANAGSAAPGVAGARANTPMPVQVAAVPTAAIMPLAPGSPASRSSDTSNFEVGKTAIHTISPSGQLARLSVAVLVDDDRTSGVAANAEAPAPKPRSAEELERLHKLVAAAVGFDEARGDQLTVENISFDDGNPVAPEPPKTMVQRVTTVVQSDQLQGLGKSLGVILLATLAFFLFLKPVMNRALAPQTTISLPAVAGVSGVPSLSGIGGSLPTVGDLEQQVQGGMVTDTRRLPALTRTISKLADEEPESVARLVRSWIADND